MKENDVDPLLVIKRLREELHGKVERSVLIEVDRAISKLEEERKQHGSDLSAENIQLMLRTLGLLVKVIPWIKSFIDGL
jgi:hypothetical protein